jgi:hypothetical protein
MKQIIIYKISDADDETIKPKYFTLKGLRIYILSELWDMWADIGGDACNDFSKNEIAESDEYLFAYLDRWNYNVVRILITDNEEIYF